MPTKAQILNILANEPAPLHRNKIAEKLGENTYRSFQTQLDRFEKQELIDGTQDHEYSITELGMKELSSESMVTEELDEEKLGTTEYQKFIQLGKMHGVAPPELIKLTADHVWAGGDFHDLDWVAKAFEEMGVRTDLRNRWWHSWRVYLHQPIPSRIPAEIVEGDGKTGVKKESKGKRNYILDAEDKPVYVGEGYGDLDYEDALELSKMRTARASRVPVAVSGTAQTPGDSLAAKAVDKILADMQEKAGDRNNPIEETTQFVTQFKQLAEVLGVNTKSDSTEEMTKLVNLYTSLKEMFESGKPAAVAGPAPTQWIVDKATGEVKPWQPGQAPVIMLQQPQAPQSQYPYTPIQMKDKDGNPMVLDLSTFIRLEEHRDKQRHDEESHETKQEIAKSFKDLIGKATSALGHMAEEK